MSITRNGRRVATAAFDGTVRVWDLRSGDPITVIRNEDDVEAVAANTAVPRPSFFNAVDFSDDDTSLVTAGSDGTARVWAVADGAEAIAYQAHDAGIRRLSFSHDGAWIATASADRTAAVWRAADGKQVFRTPASRFKVYGVAFSPDDKLVATAGNEGVSLWDLGAGTRLHLFPIGGTASDVAFSPDGKRLYAIAGTKGYILAVADGKVLHVLEGHEEELAAVGASQSLVATAGLDKKILLWNPDTGAQVGQLEGHLVGILHLAFSHDGAYLISGGKDKSAIIWNVKDQKSVALLPAHDDVISGVAMSPDGTLVATSTGTSTTLWNVRDHKPAPGFPVAEPGGESVAFSPDGRLLASGGGDGVVRLYPLRFDDLLALANRRAGRALSADECASYSGAPCAVDPRALADEARRKLIADDKPGGLASFAKAAELDPNRPTAAAAAARFIAASELENAREEVTQRLFAAIDDKGADGKTLVDKLEKVANDRKPLSRLLEAALASDPSVSLDLQEVSASLTSSVLLDMARRLAVDGDPRAPTVMFRLATKIDPSLKIEPEDEAMRLVITKQLEATVDRLHASDWAGARKALPPLGPSLRALVQDDRLGLYLRLYSEAFGDAEAPSKRGVSSDPDTLAAQSLAAFQKDDFRGARRIARAALKLDPDSDVALFVEGAALFQLGQPKEALAALDAVPETSKLFRFAVSVAGPIYFEKTGQIEMGYQRMRAALSDGDDFSTGDWANFAEVALATGRPYNAERAARLVLEPSHPPALPYVQLAVRFVLVTVAVLRDNFDLAREELGPLVQVAPSGRKNGWSYVGITKTLGRTEISPQKRKFINALLRFVEPAGDQQDAQALAALLPH